MHTSCGQPVVPETTDALKAAAAEFRLSSGETIDEASRSRPLALVFLRHFGCTFTRQIIKGLDQLQQQAQAAGAELVLVHMLKSGTETKYLSNHSDVTRIADPECKLYRAFGLGRGNFIELFGPRVWWLGMVSVFKGCAVGHLAGDGLQMPGAFIYHNGRLTAARRAKSASELPDLPTLLTASDRVS